MTFNIVIYHLQSSQERVFSWGYNSLSIAHAMHRCHNIITLPEYGQ